jgi:hypothetical protein
MILVIIQLDLVVAPLPFPPSTAMYISLYLEPGCIKTLNYKLTLKYAILIG